MATAPGKPIIHKLHDPTGIAGLRGKCLAEMRKRCRKSEAEVKAYVKGHLNRHLVDIETNRSTYIYEVSPDASAIAEREIRNIIYRNMLGIDDTLWSVRWWMNPYLQASFTRGTGDSLQSIKNISQPEIVGAETAAEVRSLDVEEVIRTPPYRRRLEQALGRSFNNMVGFSDDTVKAAGRVLGDAVTSGKNYRAVAKDFNKVFDDMAGYRALRIVRTEMNKINNDAYTDNTKQINKTVFGAGSYEVAVMHLSALIPFSTRPPHASRHGTVHTPAEQNEWWDEGSNRINCLCSVTDVLRDKKTGEVLQTALHKKAVAQGEAFFKG